MSALDRLDQINNEMGNLKKEQATFGDQKVKAVEDFQSVGREVSKRSGAAKQIRDQRLEAREQAAPMREQMMMELGDPAKQSFISNPLQREYAAARAKAAGDRRVQSYSDLLDTEKLRQGDIMSDVGGIVDALVAQRGDQLAARQADLQTMLQSAGLQADIENQAATRAAAASNESGLAKVLEQLTGGSNDVLGATPGPDLGQITLGSGDENYQQYNVMTPDGQVEVENPYRVFIKYNPTTDEFAMIEMEDADLGNLGEYYQQGYKRITDYASNKEILGTL